MTAPSPHLDLDALADALAGEDDPAGAAHLAGCGSCASRLDELAAAETRVVAVLGALPSPAVPADLADRLTAAVAAQSLSPAAPAAVGASVTALPAARARSRRTWLPAAAAAVLLASGAGLGVALFGDGIGGGIGGGSTDSAATPADALAERGAARPDLLLTESGADWSDPAAGTTALPRVLSGAADRVALQGPASASGSDTESGAQSVDGLEVLRTPEGLAACLASLLPQDEPDLVPLAVDYASYAGEPALAVVLPDPDPAQVSIFVVGAGCSARGDSTLFFLRAPRP